MTRPHPNHFYTKNGIRSLIGQFIGLYDQDGKVRVNLLDHLCPMNDVFCNNCGFFEAEFTKIVRDYKDPYDPDYEVHFCTLKCRDEFYNQNRICTETDIPFSRFFVQKTEEEYEEFEKNFESLDI